MNPIVRMMKRYIKMPLKYALPLLFIGALVLVSTTGCLNKQPDYPGQPIETLTQESWHKGNDVRLTTTTVDAIKTKEVVEVYSSDNVFGGKCTKQFDNHGSVTSIEWVYADGTSQKKVYDPAIDDPLPGLLPGVWLVDHASATNSPTPTEQPTAVPTEQPTAVPTEEPNDNIAPYVPFGTNFSSGHAYLGAGHTCLAFI